MINHYNSVLCSCCVHPQEFCHLFAMPFSVVVSCGLPDVPGNGSVNTSTGNVGDVARYSCDTGYTLNGTAERTCQADGQWNGSVPKCESEIDTGGVVTKCAYCKCDVYCHNCMNVIMLYAFSLYNVYTYHLCYAHFCM